MVDDKMIAIVFVFMKKRKKSKSFIIQMMVAQ